MSRYDESMKGVMIEVRKEGLLHGMVRMLNAGSRAPGVEVDRL